GENSVEVNNWETKLKSARAEEERLKTQISECENEMNQQKNAAQEMQTPLNQLNSTIQQQQSELENLKTDYKNVALEQGTDSKAAQDLKSKIDTLNSELNENEQKLRDVEKAADSAGDEVEESGKQAEAASNGGWTVMKGALSNLLSEGISKACDGLKTFAKDTVQLGVDFTSSMSNVQALSGASTKEMEQLEKTARSLGSSTIFSAKEVSDAFSYMALAGWDTKDMLNSVEGVLNLAAASGEDLASTSDIVTDAMTAFGLSADGTSKVLKDGVEVEVSNCTRFVDALAKASNSSNTTVSMLGESFEYVAPVAGSLGYSVEDTAVALGLMANQGIKASQSGTALRTIITNMANPTDAMSNAMDALGVSLEDDEGNVKSLMEVMTDLRDGFGGGSMDAKDFSDKLSQLDESFTSGKIKESKYTQEVENLCVAMYGAEGAQKAQLAATLAGKTGMAGLLAIVNTTDEDFDGLSDSLNNASGTAKTMAEVMQDNLGGDLTELNSAFEEFKLGIYKDVEEPLRNAIQYVTGTIIPAVTNAYNWITEHKSILAVIGGVIAVVTTALAAQAVVQGVKAAMNAAEATSLGALISMKLADAAASMAALAPYILIAAAIAAVVAAIIWAVKHWDLIKEKVTEVAIIVGEKMSEMWEGIKSVFSAIGDFFKDTWNKIKETFSSALSAISDFVSKSFDSVKKTFSNVWNAISKFVSSVWNGIKTAVTTAVNSVKNVISTVFNAIRTLISNCVNRWKEIIFTVWNAIKTTVSTVVNTIKTVISNVFNSVKNTVSTIWNAIKTAIYTPISKAKELVTTSVDSIKDKVTNVFQNIKNKVTTIWNGIKTAITSPIESAKNTIKNIIDKIKSFFGFKITWPKIPMPHFSVTPSGWKIGDLLKGSIPKLGISWYAKGAIFDSPTVFPTAYGFKGVGEAGPEAVTPISVLQDYVTEAVENANVFDINYELLADKVARACAKMNISLDLDGRELGRAVRRYV
ncbi:MAG: phage tail tape measure protein, partial [Ruminococcus sp.]|nr:phage tail tape measure protein [Ruminococcus sp.]